jgi:hypothetical protein
MKDIEQNILTEKKEEGKRKRGKLNGGTVRTQSRYKLRILDTHFKIEKNKMK